MLSVACVPDQCHTGRNFPIYFFASFFVLSFLNDEESGTGYVVVRPVTKLLNLLRLELATMSFVGTCSTTEIPVHIWQVDSIAAWQSWKLVSSHQLLFSITVLIYRRHRI